MNHTLPDKVLQQLSGFIASNLALNFPKERWSDLERDITLAAKDFRYSDTEKFIKHITSTPLSRVHSETLASYLTINETYFWREPKSFDALEKKILPDLIRLRQKEEKRIRIWSAGCSTGEEPYSIAIALRRIIPEIDTWNITILATDINSKMLLKANIGEYGQWSFRNAPEWLKEKYFIRKEKGKFEIVPEVKKMLSFEYLNLAEDVFPSPLNNTNAMDLIFCRNVLMYFTPERMNQTSMGLFNSLVKGGYLFVSASELSCFNIPEFSPVTFSGAIIYRRTWRDSSKVSDISWEKMNLQEGFIEAKQEPFVEIAQKEPQSKAAIMDLIQPAVDMLPLSKFEEALNLYSLGCYSEVIDKLEKDAVTTLELMLLIRAYANQGKLSEAIVLCEKAIVVDKLDPKIRYLYAIILQEHNQMNEAVALLKHTIYLDQNFVLSYYSLGNIFLRQGNLNGAKKCYSNVLMILNKCKQDEILPESEGLTAGRFREIINVTIRTRL